MALPGLVQDRLAKPGGVVSAVAVVLGLALSALALGAVVTLAAACLGLLALVYDIHRDVERLKARLSERDSELELAQQDRVALSRSEGARRELDEQLAAIKQQLEAVQARGASPLSTIEQLAWTIDKAALLIDEAIQHRNLSAQGAGRWPVLRMELSDEGDVKVIARAEDEAPITNLTLVNPSGEPITPGEVQVGTQGELRMDCLLSDLPVDIQEEIRVYGGVSPADYALVLAGVTVNPFRAVEDAHLAEISAAVRALDLALSEALSRSKDDPETEER